MGKRTFAGLAAQLIAAGPAADTPALLAEGVSTPDQRLRRATIATLAALIETLRPTARPDPVSAHWPPMTHDVTPVPSCRRHS